MGRERAEGTITILFAGIEAFTDLATRPGDDGAHAMLRAQQVRLPISLNTGEAVHQEADRPGAAVRAAARIARKARRGSVSVPKASHGIVGPVTDLRFLDRGRFRREALHERWGWCEVAW